MDDQTIIELFWQRSERALQETAHVYGGYCRSIAMRILQNGSDAEECVNDAYLRLWNAIPPQRPKSLKLYLGKITRNLALNSFERQSAQKRGGGAIPQMLDELTDCLRDCSESLPEDRAVFADLMNRFLADLSEEARQMFVQRYWYGYSVKEIARAHKVSSDSVAAVMLRTRKKLAQYLKEKGEFI